MSELAFRARQPASLWRNNPVLVQLLGLSPLLAVSTSMLNSAGLGLTTGLVLLCASLTVSVSRRLLQSGWRFVAYLLILAIYTTFADLLLQWQFYPLHRSLGVYLPLICCNLALVVQLDTHARHETAMQATASAAITAVAYLLVFVVFAMLREWLATGTIAIDWTRLLSSLPRAGSTTAAPGALWSFHFILLPPAACILLGAMLALRNWLSPGTTLPPPPRQVIPVPRARVTGKIQNS